MKKRYYLAAALAIILSMGSCSDFLDQTPDRILTEDQVYSDPNLIKSVLANFYERVSFGQHVQGDLYDFTRLDDAMRYDFDNVNQFDRNRWRVYDYGLIRNINQFIQGLTKSTALTEDEKAPLFGEARLIRAWIYFNTCRGLGGMPIVGDEVFTYTPGMDITPLQIPRATEAAMYDYVISECNEISKMMLSTKTTNSARANRWTAKMLEARAALYAASIARYNNRMVAPVETPGKEVGIDAAKAEGYYKVALAAAKEVIENSPYSLQDRRPEDKARNFYEAVTVKDNNTEVIWARDYIYPGQTHAFTKDNLPTSFAEDAQSSYLSVLLNLVEEYEPIDTPTPGQGSKFKTGDLAAGTPIFYETPDQLFKERDPRLGGTVLYPGSLFRGLEVVLQVGQLNQENGKWVKKEGNAGDKDDKGNLITSPNGPVNNSTLRLVNKTGFSVRKFLDEAKGSGTVGRGSEIWGVRFRMAEAYMIAAEASYELYGGGDANTVKYINAVRNRAGVQPLATVTFENIIHERRVEFAFEDQRYWDMKRWRLADKAWNGNQASRTANRLGLWPYRVVAEGNPNNGKWVFVEKDMNFIYPNALNFELRHYYNELDNGWLNNNPKLVKNPYQ